MSTFSGYSYGPPPFPPLKPAAVEEQQQKKRSYVTNFVQGQGKSADDVSLPRIATGGVVPFFMGRDIIRNPDLMWYGNLKPISKSVASQEVVTDAGGNETVVTTITTSVVAYTVDVQFSTGLGPGVRLRSILVDNAVVWTGTSGPARSTFTVSGSDTITEVIFNGGNFDQVVDPYLQAQVAQTMTAYRGFSYIVLKSLDTTKLSNISFEVDRYPDPLTLGAENKIGDDINPASAIAEIITSTWGGAGQDASVIGPTFDTMAALFFDESNGCSIMNRTVASANDLIGILCDQVNGNLYENHETGQIELSVFRKDFDRTNLLRLFDKDIISVSNMDKASWQSIPTNIKGSYIDRSLNYREIPLVARNLAISSKIKKSTVETSFPAVRVKTLAAELLAREGAKSGSPVQQISITTNRKTASCNPGDVILITCSKYRYFSQPAIVVKRRTQPIENNTVTLICNVILYPNNNVLFTAPEDSFFVAVDPYPHAPIDVKMISAPYFLRFSSTSVNGTYDYLSNTPVRDYTQDVPVVFGDAFNASQTNMGGYYDFGGVDTRFYAGVTVPISPGIDFGYPITGKLTGSIDKFDNWDGSQITITIHGLGKQLMDYASILNSFTAVLGQTALIWIDDEIFVLDRARDFGTAALTIDYDLGTLVLTGCRRAYGDTVAQDHATNADVYVTSHTYTVNYLSKLPFAYGSTPDFKFVGAAFPKKVYTLSSISTALAYNGYTASDRANRPLRPHDTKIAGARGTSTPTSMTRGNNYAITWKIRSRVTQTGTLTPKFQTDANEVGEVLTGNHIVYRVFIIDSALVSWDCGTTPSGADTDNKTITVPAGAAAGVGELYVQAEFTVPSGLKVSQYQDRMPVTLV